MSIKLISLNIWGGRRKADLLSFVKRHSRDIDVFCFQEVLDKQVSKAIMLEKLKYSGSDYLETPHIYKDLSHVLKGFDSWTARSSGTGGEKLGIFVRNGLISGKVLEKATNPFKVKVFDKIFTMRGMTQLASIKKDGKQFNVINIHGLWQGGGKKDTPERLKQSALLVELANKVKRKRLVICGDFNLEPSTDSILMLDKLFRNLIKENKIKSTRSSLYAHASKGKFADYTFVTRDVKVKKFRVLKEHVSDHLPMYIEFS